MVKSHLNAVFYSKGNIDKAYVVKNTLWKTKFQVTNISEFSDLIYNLHKKEVNLLVVDCETIKLTDEFMCVMQKGKQCAPDNIIFAGVETACNKFETDNTSRFTVTYSELPSFFKHNYEKILFNIEKNYLKKYNINQINKFLTQYLIKLGFLPKHIGFGYIKQCIEEAVNRNGVLGSLSTEIYPVVARRNGTTAVNIERNIRNSIECAYKYSELKDDSLKDMLKKHKRISNRAFLSYLLDQVLISCYEVEDQLGNV